jgi:hypothetical protein
MNSPLARKSAPEEISPAMRALLVSVRRALLAICAAIAEYLGLEDKNRG